MADWHLMRTWYRTDREPGSIEETVGMFSATIPERAFNGDPGRIVNVDWSVPSWVGVTFVVPGRGFEQWEAGDGQ